LSCLKQKGEKFINVCILQKSFKSTNKHYKQLPHYPFQQQQQHGRFTILPYKLLLSEEITKKMNLKKKIISSKKQSS
jgi:hypothetical protein